MLRRMLAAIAALVVVSLSSTNPAFAAVDVNSADATQLQTIKGIGPATSAKIVAERRKGSFKDWGDLVSRVPGIGDKNSASMSQAGLTVGGRSKADAPMSPAAIKPATAAKSVATPPPAIPTTAPASGSPVTTATETTTSTRRTSKPDATSAPATTETRTTKTARTGDETTTSTTKSKKTGNDATAASEMSKSGSDGPTVVRSSKARSAKSDRDAATSPARP